MASILQPARRFKQPGLELLADTQHDDPGIDFDIEPGYTGDTGLGIDIDLPDLATDQPVIVEFAIHTDFTGQPRQDLNAALEFGLEYYSQLPQILN